MPATTTFSITISFCPPVAATHELGRAALAGVLLASRAPREPLVLGGTQCSDASVGRQHRSFGLAGREALHLLALPGAEQQDIWRQGPVGADATVGESGRGVAASRRRGPRPGAKPNGRPFSSGFWGER